MPDGRINNVDVHTGFTDHPALAHIAVASDRTHVALAIYAIDAKTGHVKRVDAHRVPAELNDIYGLCMYQSSSSGNLYAIATSGDSAFHQWRLFPTTDGRVDAESVRKVKVGTMTESCMVDDENAYLYLTEETRGIWRYGAEPDSGSERSAVDMIRENGVLTGDLEGLVIYSTSDRDGYLVGDIPGSGQLPGL